MSAAALGLAILSCTKDATESYNQFEDQALEAWITQHRPELLGNYQAHDGDGYYIDVIDAGDAEAGPVNDTICWVRFDFSGRDLAGNIILTRNAAEAKLAGTFTRYTHYVPYYRYCGEANMSLMEGTWLAMRRKQVLGDDYYAANKERLGISSPELLLRKGSKVVLYMPSRVVGTGGVEGTGGYEGQYALDADKPYIVTMEICDTIKNPLQHEGSAVDGFCTLPANGGLQIYASEDEEKKPANSVPAPEDEDDPNHPYNIPQRWVSAADTIPQLYVNHLYTPDEQLTFPEPYAVGYEPYVSEGSVRSLDERIAEALKERFAVDDDGNPTSWPDPRKLTDSVKSDGKAKIWYIGRFLDGFIFDTNIDEVKELIYGEIASSGSAFDFTASSSGSSSSGAIQAFNLTIPNLKFGQWAAVITTSTYAYGSSGVAGSSSTSTTSNGYSSSYYDYLNYLNYANSYYGSSYGSYYPGYYGGYGYGYGYYNPYYGYGYDYGTNYGSTTETTETTTTITTEIPPFTPLLFELYIEPSSK